jgi:hypothetical protein
MLSNVHYPRLPRIGVRTIHGISGLVVNVTLLGFAIFSRDVFFFPLGIAYMTYGMARGAAVSILDRGDVDDEGELAESLRPTLVKEFRARRRRKRG